jgi:hypothetical protein
MDNFFSSVAIPTICEVPFLTPEVDLLLFRLFPFPLTFPLENALAVIASNCFTFDPTATWCYGDANHIFVVIS